MAIQALLPSIASILAKTMDTLFLENGEKQKIEAEVLRQLWLHQAEIEKAAALIVQTEATSNHWLAANWRPLLMLVFGALIVARWFGWAAPNLSESEYLKLWSIVEFGIGGYVVGRSLEKITPQLADVLKNKKSHE